MQRFTGTNSSRTFSKDIEPSMTRQHTAKELKLIEAFLKKQKKLKKETKETSE